MILFSNDLQTAISRARERMTSPFLCAIWGGFEVAEHDAGSPEVQFGSEGDHPQATKKWRERKSREKKKRGGEINIGTSISCINASILVDDWNSLAFILLKMPFFLILIFVSPSPFFANSIVNGE